MQFHLKKNVNNLKCIKKNDIEKNSIMISICIFRNYFNSDVFTTTCLFKGCAVVTREKSKERAPIVGHAN